MSALRVTPDQLQSMSGAVARTSGDIRGMQQSLRSQLSALFGADWTGAAAAQFTVLYDQFDQHARGCPTLSTASGNCSRGPGAAYADVEQQIAASFR